MLEFKLTDHRPWWKQVIHGVTLSIGVMFSSFVILCFSVVCFALMSFFVQSGFLTFMIYCVLLFLFLVALFGFGSLHDWSKK